MPDEPKKRDIGPMASLHRSLLNDQQRELFDWFTTKLVGSASDAKFFGSLLQGIACKLPSIGYWAAVLIAREISSSPDFDKLRQETLVQADINLNKPIDS